MACEFRCLFIQKLTKSNALGGVLSLKQLSYSKSSLLMSVAMIFAILPIFQLGFLPAFLFSEEYFYTIPISNIFGDLFFLVAR